MRVNGRRVRFLLTAVTLLAGLLIRAAEAQDLSVVGQWSSPQAWPVTAVHNHMLPTGKVLFWGYTDEAWLWDAGARWRLTEARDINDSGQIVGTGIFNRQVRAFLLTPKGRPGPGDVDRRDVQGP